MSQILRQYHNFVTRICSYSNLRDQRVTLAEACPDRHKWFTFVILFIIELYQKTQKTRHNTYYLTIVCRKKAPSHHASSLAPVQYSLVCSSSSHWLMMMMTHHTRYCTIDHMIQRNFSEVFMQVLKQVCPANLNQCVFVFRSLEYQVILENVHK